ncbi:response regulator [Sphingomonas sp. JC676]|uniref:response regulator n=1 Tax=Sphingomonas sp. JC676 TaxID=2768065 RepID=UPI0016583855|nr:response regulator [Sphingomonas sp. JC676]MBC9030907.1 response regulator [Sphingomonas sp. JC676]
MNEFGPLRVLVVEDEPVVAMCLEDILDALGCVPVGPAGRLSEGLALAENEALDAAILDINLAGERSTPIAEALRARGVPFAFASGYGATPEGFTGGAPLIEKPYGERDIATVLRTLLG